MRNELIILGSVLLVSGVLPMAFAHTSVADPLEIDSSPTSTERPSTVGVAGNSFAGAGPFVDSDESGLVATGAIICDFEVLGPGSAEDPRDETQVDAEPTIGNVPDGTIDDGGTGGACHTSQAYGYEPYNTAGCAEGGPDADTESDQVRGDVVSNGDAPLGLFVVASCDVASTTGGTAFAGCVANAVLNPEGDPPVVGDIQDQCLQKLDPTGPPEGEFQACSSAPNGEDDEGTTTSGYVTPTDGFNAPTVTDANNAIGPDANCGPEDGSMALFVFSGIDANEDVPRTGGATPGWVATI